MNIKLPFEIEAGAICAVEHAAIAAYSYVGLGDEIAADKVAIKAMHSVLSKMKMKGRIIFGEGDEFDSPILFEGEAIGDGMGHEFDIALDALEGTTLAAKAMQNALSVIAIAPKGGLFRVPNLYMEKIAIGANYPQGIIDIDNEPQENIKRIAEFKGVDPSLIGVCVLDRPRHAGLIAKLREARARVFLIPDGDVAGVLFATDPNTHIDMYMGVGGAPEGVLAAAALSCIGGQFQGRLVIKTQEERQKAAKIGITDINKKYNISDLVSNEVVFAACGVTNGTMLKGVCHDAAGLKTETMSINSQAKMLRIVQAIRYDGIK